MHYPSYDGHFLSKLGEMVQHLVDMFARTGQDNRESVANMVEDAAPDGYEVDMDEVMAAIEAGA